LSIIEFRRTKPAPRPKRSTNAEVRTREYLTHAEVEQLIKVAAGNRYGHRDATLILVASRHGLRVSELIDLRWDQVDFNRAEMHVRRVKHGSPATHPIPGPRVALVAPAPARTEAAVSLCVHIGTWCAIFQSRRS
jgi:type 1 fimbriae regulatory protein FimB/type 1 fimbriae regulatory protein FimE